jgi:DNA-damage-inducible protein J
MSNTSMNIRMDSEIKGQAQKIFAELGLDMTTAVNLFLRQSIRVQGIPFDLRLETPNAETRAAIEEVQRMKVDPSLGKTYTNVDEMMKELLR